MGALDKPGHGQRPVYRLGRWEIDLAHREVRAHGSRAPIGGRAFDILETLVEAAGELVSQKDLMDRVWPGIIVEGNALQVHISSLRKALGSDRGLLKTASGRGYRLLGNWVAERPNRADAKADAESERSPAQPFQLNVPILTSSLVGRAAAAQELRELLSAYRAITLIGPGGIGKTALALQVARGLFPSFHGDVLVAELASLSDPSLVPSTVASALGLGSTLEEFSPEAIARSIDARKLLLVLDNCEHVIDAAAALVETLVRMCQHTTVLATSRETLRIDGEYAYRVLPLDVPPAEPAGEEIFSYSAVQLFIARTRALHSGFAVVREDLPAIAAICRRLDGIPLALEFAAARAATIGVQQVASRLEDRFQLLTQGRRRALPRHRTLRATLDWSYDLLSEPEQRLLRHLAVFPGGFTVEAAAFVSGNEVPAVAEGISDLVSKSLVAFDGSTQADRWRLLETVRAYAFDKLTDSGEADRAGLRQADFFRHLVGPTRPGSRVQPSVQDLARYVREIDNVRAALDWSFSLRGDARVGVELTSGYVPVWTYYALLSEGRERIERALEALGADPSGQSRLQLHAVLGMALLATLGPADRSTALLAKVVAEAENRGDLDAQLQALYVLSVAYVNLGEADRSVSTMERFGRIAPRSGDPSAIIAASQMLGYTLHFKGAHSEARRCIEHGRELFETLKEQKSAIWFHTTQPLFARALTARILWLQGFVDQGIAQAREVFQDVHAVESPLLRWASLRTAVCPLAIISGNLSTAQNAMTMMTELATSQNVTWRNTVQCLQGRLLIARGEFENGVAILRDALETCDRTGWTTWYPEFLTALAEGWAGLGRLARAVSAAERAQAVAERGGECWYLPEVLRIKGELLLQDPGDRDVAAAATCFDRALAVAQQQTALSWELRAAVSLARLRVAQGRDADASQILAPVYGRFTEGFDTADLRAARTVLEALS
jgi:predicted ATPase/DNA-binding winged helix-turn-helix (wHTH) protein